MESSGIEVIKGTIKGSEVNTALVWNYLVPEDLIKGLNIWYWRIEGEYSSSLEASGTGRNLVV